MTLSRHYFHCVHESKFSFHEYSFGDILLDPGLKVYQYVLRLIQRLCFLKINHFHFPISGSLSFMIVFILVVNPI